MNAVSILDGLISRPQSDPYSDKNSIEFGFRARRFASIERVLKLILEEKGTANIIDLGGTETYWLVGKDFIDANRHRLNITIVNITDESPENGDIFTYHRGSASDPALFRDRQFDFVHSNSVIEHLGSYDAMKVFAENTRRLAPRYYVQTPNYWFPYEPHFRFPGFQYLPRNVRRALIMRYSLGFFSRIDDRAEAEDIIRHHSLLSTHQMTKLFPDAVISHEKFAGLNKSIMAIRE